MDPTPPVVSCKPAGAGCDQVDRGSGGASGVIGLTTVDGAKITPEAQPFPDIEPPDQSLSPAMATSSRPTTSARS